MKRTAVCLATLALLTRAQSEHPAFEVASVKPHANTADTNSSINTPVGGRLECSNVTLRGLIAYAYDLRDYQITGAPAFAETDRYDVFAKPSEEDAAREPPRYSDAANQLSRRRTQALLAERFHLKVHNDSKEMSVYSLIVAKGGSKLQTSTTDTPFPQMSWNNVRVICKKVTMDRFAQVLLAGRMNRYVINDTGLTGEYDFRMDFQPEERGRSGAAPAELSSGPSFENALQEQLGLRLVAAKGPVPFLVIDHAERASAN